MGVTILVAISFWLATSYIEYKIIKEIPLLKKVFDHPLGAIIVSVAIGICLAIVLGPAVGVGATLGQIMGLATNEFTFGLYEGGSKFLSHSKNGYRQTKDFFVKNKEFVNNAINTIRLGIKGIAAIVLGILWIVGLPFRIAEWYDQRRTTS